MATHDTARILEPVITRSGLGQTKNCSINMALTETLWAVHSSRPKVISMGYI